MGCSRLAVEIAKKGGNMKILDSTEVEKVSGGGMDGWSFGGAVLAAGAGFIAVCTAPAWGAIGGVLVIGAAGANAMSRYM